MVNLLCKTTGSFRSFKSFKFWLLRCLTIAIVPGSRKKEIKTFLNPIKVSRAQKDPKFGVRFVRPLCYYQSVTFGDA